MVLLVSLESSGRGGFMVFGLEVQKFLNIE
jgi:hypothetical protein